MKKKIWMLILSCALFAAVGCGAAKSESAMDMAPMAAPEAEAPAEMWEEAVEEEAMMGEAGVTSTTGIDSVADTSQKLIKTVGIHMETKEFDTLLENVKIQVEALGGYIESSDISGNSYYNQNGTRYAYLTLRIPVDCLDGFVTLAEELGNVTSKWESVEDITLQYVDVKSHKEALQTEQERLLELLEKAESMEDIITIESRLSQVRYELQSYESTLRTYDNKVNYSTVTLDIREVERVTKVNEERNFFEEVRYRLADNFYDIGQGIRECAIWFISSLPYLLILAVAILVILRLLRKIFRKKPFFPKRKKKLEEILTKEQDDNYMQ